MADIDPIPADDEESIKKMASIGAIMEEAGQAFTEDDMRLLRNVFSAGPSPDDEMEKLIAHYQGLDEDDEEDEDETNLNALDW